MKICQQCGKPIETGRKCPECKRANARESRQIKEEVYKSLGLKRVKGALGGIYWE